MQVQGTTESKTMAKWELLDSTLPLKGKATTDNT